MKRRSPLPWSLLLRPYVGVAPTECCRGARWRASLDAPQGGCLALRSCLCPAHRAWICFRSMSNHNTSDCDDWFTVHVRPHEPMLRAWLSQGFGPRLVIDDIVQEAFLRVLRAWSTRELQSPKAF